MKIPQFWKFCLVGSSNAVLDFGVLNLLLWKFPTQSIPVQLFYNSLAVLLASTNSFFWNKYWTFEKHTAITLQELWRFAIIALATTFVNDSIMTFLAKFLPSSSLLETNALKLAAILGTMSVSFFGMRLWVFFQKSFLPSDLQTGKFPSISPIYNLDTILLQAVQVKKRRTNPLQNPLKTLIVIPTYNEAENLPLLIKEIFLYAPQTHILVIDDNSPDNTGIIAETLQQKEKRLFVLHRKGKLGLGTAYIQGFQYAIAHGYDAVFEMDADFSHQPCHLPAFFQAIQQSDLVIGSRYIAGGKTPNWSFSRKAISGSGNIFARLLLGISVKDCTGGYRCYRTQTLQYLSLSSVQSRGYAFQIELTYRTQKKGFSICEIPITFPDRTRGSSKMSRSIVFEAFFFVLKAKWKKGFLTFEDRPTEVIEQAKLKHIHPVKLKSF